MFIVIVIVNVSVGKNTTYEKHKWVSFTKPDSMESIGAVLCLWLLVRT